MSDLYRTVKRLPATLLRESGFRSDPLNEGFYKPSDGVSIVFHVTGMWSHVAISDGLRFQQVNDMLYRAAIGADWPKARADMFKLQLVGLFWEKLSDFCAASEDIGIYCPKDSVVASPAEISDVVLAEANRLSSIGTIADALTYACENELFEPFGVYMIPAAAKITNNPSLWDWSLKHFTPMVLDDERPSYVDLLSVLEKS